MSARVRRRRQCPGPNRRRDEIVIDYSVGAQFFYERRVRCGSGGDGLRSKVLGKLNREDSHTARSTMDQDTLTRASEAMDAQRLPRRERRQWNSGNLYVID
jgi:hypothetical protein